VIYFSPIWFTRKCLLSQGEVNRKEEELEMRRQELHRVREQNHGYQERLQSKSKTEHLAPSPVKGGQKALVSSPNLSPSHSRPNSLASLSPSSDPQEDKGEFLFCFWILFVAFHTHCLVFQFWPWPCNSETMSWTLDSSSVYSVFCDLINRMFVRVLPLCRNRF